MGKIEKIIERIRKLLAIGNSKKNPYEGEVNTALALAKKLMKEHNLSLSEVEVRESSDNDIGKIYSRDVGRMRFWEKLLATNVVAPIFECEAIYSRGCILSRYCFVGYKEDPSFAKEVYEYLVEYIKVLGKFAESDRKRRTSYYEGLIERLIERAKEEVELNEMQKTEMSHCRALVIAKEERTKRYLDENMNLTSMRFSYRSRKDFYPDSYNKGRKDANNIDLRNRKKVTKED